MQTVNIIECGPRDGFQNLSDYIPPEKKLAVIDSLVNAGVREMEFTSFVHPRAIPQLRDAKELTQAVLERYPGVHFFPSFQTCTAPEARSSAVLIRWRT